TSPSARSSRGYMRPWSSCRRRGAVRQPPSSCSNNPSPRPPPRSGEGEKDSSGKSLREEGARSGCSPSAPPLRFGEGGRGEGLQRFLTAPGPDRGRAMHPMDDNLVGYLLDALDADTRRAVEDHLRTHPEARARLDRLRRLLEPLEADREPPAPPPHLVQATLARVAEARGRPLPF